MTSGRMYVDSRGCKKKIGVFGAHGTGKTTRVNDLANEYDPFINLTIIQETARKCPYPINKQMSIDSQRWILAEQISAEHQAAQGADVIICDRTVLDPVVYGIWAGRHTSDLERQVAWSVWADRAQSFVMDWIKTYDELYFCRPNGTPPAADGFRDTDPTFQDTIDQFFSKVVDGLGIAHYDHKTIFTEKYHD